MTEIQEAISFLEEANLSNDESYCVKLLIKAYRDLKKSAEEKQEKLDAEAISMWQKGELTTEEVQAASHFMRRLKDELAG